MQKSQNIFKIFCSIGFIFAPMYLLGVGYSKECYSIYNTINIISFKYSLYNKYYWSRGTCKNNKNTIY